MEHVAVGNSVRGGAKATDKVNAWSYKNMLGYDWIKNKIRIVQAEYARTAPDAGPYRN